MTNINSLFCVATVCFIISDLFSRGRIGNHTLAWVFSCKFGHLFRTPFPKNTSGGLLLYSIGHLFRRFLIA